MTTYVDLFGNVIDEFTSAKDRYGVWPTTVWPCDMTDPTTRRLKAMVSDAESDRHRRVDKTFGYQDGASVFNPAVAAWALNCYAPRTGVCVDPFAGGGTRAILATKHGLRYVGCEIRQEEVAAVQARCDRLGVADRVELIQGDARFLSTFVGQGVGDFLLTCPPYYNLEQYGGGVGDLSMCPTYEQFIAEIRTVINQTFNVLKPGAVAFWVTGLHRDQAGGLLPIHHDIAACHRQAGFRFKEEIVLHVQNSGAIQRVGQFDKGDRRLVRVHEYAQVFVR